MSKFKTIRQGAFLTLASLYVLATPWATKRAVARAVWDAEPTFDQHGAVSTIRGDLLPKDAWRGTLDDRLPGGTYEPTIAKMLADEGRDATAIHWVGVRSDGTWYWERRALGFKAVAGHRIYKLLDGSFSAVPAATIKKA